MEAMSKIINSQYFDIIIGFLAGGGVVGCFFKIVKTSFKGLGAIQNGVKAMLHERIYKECEYWLAKNYCPLEERRELQYLYEPYKELNGNSTAEELYGRVKKLPYNLELKQKGKIS